MKPVSGHARKLFAAVILAGGCAGQQPGPATELRAPEILTVRDDGSMWFRDRPMAKRDVIIYEDGMGGEKAAVRIRMEPLHPDFFRDTIVVVRE